MLKPWLWLPTKVAHDLSPFYLQARAFMARPVALEWRPLAWRGLRFANRLGLAGGVDKDGSAIPAWWTLGPGFVEIGTVTPRPQGPNPGKIMARDIPRRALWNKMGFPSAGVERVAGHLAKLHRPYHTPVLVNIGKNRSTPNEKAADDYVDCLQRLHDAADAFVVNVSSPNTSGLRELLKPANLSGFLSPILSARDQAGRQRTVDGALRPKPVLLKISPDLTPSDLDNALLVSCELGIDGWIVSNTTLSRRPGSPFPAEGGVSGEPLAELSRRTLVSALKTLGPRRDGKLVVSAGGALSPDDVRERLDLGADLVQVYSALIFSGPGFFRQVADAFSAARR